MPKFSPPHLIRFAVWVESFTRPAQPNLDHVTAAVASLRLSAHKRCPRTPKMLKFTPNYGLFAPARGLVSSSRIFPISAMGRRVPLLPQPRKSVSSGSWYSRRFPIAVNSSIVLLRLNCTETNGPVCARARVFALGGRARAIMTTVQDTRSAAPGNPPLVVRMPVGRK